MSHRFEGLVKDGLFWIQIIYLKDYLYLMYSCSYSNRMLPFKHLGLNIMLGMHMLLHQWPALSVHRYMISESGCSQISACCLAAARPTDGLQTEFHREHVCAGGRVSRRSQILISEQDCHNRVWFSVMEQSTVIMQTSARTHTHTHTHTTARSHVVQCWLI